MSAGLKRASSSPAKSKSAPVSRYRGSMIAKINIAWKQLRMAEEDYRAALVAVTGQKSLTGCSDAQLARMLEWLASKGFRAVQARGTATHPMARKARALWISLYHLNAVDKPSEQALEAFAKRQLKCEKLVWANQRDAYKLIEALKSWAVRAGWPEAGRNGTAVAPIALQSTLCAAILTKLKEAGIAKPGWDLLGAAMRLQGEIAVPDRPWGLAEYQRLAEQLGAVLRTRSNRAETPLAPPSERQ